MNRLIYRLNNCIDADDNKQRIEVLEELIYIAQRRLKWEREELSKKEVEKALEQIRTFEGGE